MKFARVFLGAMILMAVGVGCETGEGRRTEIDQVTRPDFRDRHVKDIAVLPPTGVQVSSPSGIVLPATELRHTTYLYLLRERKYAVPENAWVDSRAENGDWSCANLNCDGLLKMNLDAWDASTLGSQGCCYAAATFELVDKTGAVVWSYRCRELKVEVRPPFGADNTLINLREAAGRLVETALDTLPPSPRWSVEEIEKSQQ